MTSSLRRSAVGGSLKHPRSFPSAPLPTLLNVVKKFTAAIRLDSTLALQPLPYPSSSSSSSTSPTPSSSAAAKPESQLLFRSKESIVVSDPYAKARVHCLVMPLDASLRSLNDLTAAHVPLLRTMQATGQQYIDFLQSSSSSSSSSASNTNTAASSDTVHPPEVSVEAFPTSSTRSSTGMRSATKRSRSSDDSTPTTADNSSGNKSNNSIQNLRMLLGFHALPSLPMLHMHLISLDLESDKLKTKHHYNSFATYHFLPADAVLKDLEANGEVTINQDVDALEKLCNGPMHCLWCGKPLANMPEMKQHVPACPLNMSRIAVKQQQQ